jgi:Holliday junction resolvasome RuvABC endonuclease subunit
MPIKVLGCDGALNHGAVVELTDGELSWFSYYTSNVGAAKQSKDGHRVPARPAEIDKHAWGVQRLAWLEDWWDKQVFVTHRPDYAGVEDYAIRAEQGAHYMGELGGIIRILLWFRGIPFRLHDPVSVKMFATNDGTAKKDLVEEMVKSQWGADFSAYNPPPNPKAKHQNRETSEDLADAYAIAKLVWFEYLMRTGQMKASELGHPKKIQVFNRVTKTYPVNILGREWIQNPKGVPAPHSGLRARIEAKIIALDGRAPVATRMLRDLLSDGV